MMLFSIMCRVDNFPVWRLTPNLTDSENVQYAYDDEGNILEFPNEEAADKYISNGLCLIENQIPAIEDCSWCMATVGVIHSRSCPNGERYKQAYQILNSGEQIKVKDPAAVSLGRRGGLVRSDKKAQKSRENGKSGGRRKAFSVTDLDLEEGD